MPEFDISYSQSLPNVVQQPRASMNMDSGAGLIGQAVANLGATAFKIGEQKKAEQEQLAKKEYEYKVYGETENGKIAVMEFDAETDKMLQGITDPDEIKAVSEKRFQDRGSLYTKFATTPESQRDLDFYTRKTAVQEAEKLEATRFARQQDRAYIGFDSMYNQMAKEGGFAAMPLKVQDAFNKGVITEKEYARRMAEVPELQHKWNYNRVRELSQAEVMATGKKEDGYRIINQAQEFGVLTAEDNKILGDSLDSFWEGRLHKGKQEQYTATLQSYDELTNKIRGVNPDNRLTYEAIYNSPMLKADKEKWAEYIKTQYKDPPKATKLDGQKSLVNAVFQANNTELSEQEALDLILNARYTDESVTDIDLAWAADRIKNPYPKHLIPEISAVIKDSEKEIKGPFGYFSYHTAASREKTARVTSGLLAWVDKELKAGREPNQEDMYAKARTLQYGVSTSYTIGDTLDANGKVFTVIGYYPDGEPAFEEVK
jgi:hypothetical protein